MDERKHNHNDPWEDGVYGTGRTQPPKNRGGIVALLLILVIFLCGITTVLGILNIRMFHQLNQQEEDSDLPISFAIGQTCPTEQTTPASEETLPAETFSSSCVTIDLHNSPESVDNVPQEGGLALQDIYDKNILCVVSISCTLPSGSSSGTGVILSEEGYIVTNRHVVENAVAISVQLTDDRVFSAVMVGSDSVSDLAVLHIDAENLDPAEFGDSNTLRVGDSVVAIGDPLGAKFRGTMTDGIVSAINRDVIVDGRTLSLIQTNAALNSGNSGGPLINCYGQVIGINTMKIGTFTDNAGVEGLGFAIPSATVKEVVDQIISQGYVSGRPTLGIQAESLSTFYQHYYRLPAGLLITQVESGSAASLGIEPGDILLSIDDTRITNVDGLNAVLYAHNVGDTVTVGLYRSGRQISVELTLTEAKG